MVSELINFLDSLAKASARKGKHLSGLALVCAIYISFVLARCTTDNPVADSAIRYVFTPIFLICSTGLFLGNFSREIQICLEPHRIQPFSDVPDVKENDNDRHPRPNPAQQKLNLDHESIHRTLRDPRTSNERTLLESDGPGAAPGGQTQPPMVISIPSSAPSDVAPVEPPISEFIAEDSPDQPPSIFSPAYGLSNSRFLLTPEALPSQDLSESQDTPVLSNSPESARTSDSPPPALTFMKSIYRPSYRPSAVPFQSQFQAQSVPTLLSNNSRVVLLPDG